MDGQILTNKKPASIEAGLSFIGANNTYPISQ
jgi:hypothetical protein